MGSSLALAHIYSVVFMNPDVHPQQFAEAIEDEPDFFLLVG